MFKITLKKKQILLFVSKMISGKNLVKNHLTPFLSMCGIGTHLFLNILFKTLTPLSSTEAPLSEVSAGAGKKAAAGLAAGASARCHTQYGRHPGVADFPSFLTGVRWCMYFIQK